MSLKRLPQIIGEIMKKISLLLFSLLIFLTLGLSSCGNKDTRTVVRIGLCNQNMLDDVAKSLREEFSDVKFEFTIANNSIDYYKYLDDHSDLPDIITLRKYSMKDALVLKDSLLDLRYTGVASSYYQNYLSSYTYTDGTINFLPSTAETYCIIANKTLFDKYGIDIPTNYSEFIEACKSFEGQGIKGFSSDFKYDYTAVETLEGFNASLFQSRKGLTWKYNYESSSDVELDDELWSNAFIKMEDMLKNTSNLGSEVANQGYTAVTNMMKNEGLAMMRGTISETATFANESGDEFILLPYFGEESYDNYVLTYASYNAAIKKDSSVDTSLLIKIYSYMLGQEVTDELISNYNTISYSKAVSLKSNTYTSLIDEYIDKNQVIIRFADTAFFKAAQTAVGELILGSSASDAYETFKEKLTINSQNGEFDLYFKTSYTYSFNDGQEAPSAILNSLRSEYDTDFALTYTPFFSNSIYEGEFNSNNIGYILSGLNYNQCIFNLTGKEIKTLVSTMLSYDDNKDVSSGLFPREDNMLPVSSGFEMDVSRQTKGYKLNKLTINGRKIEDDKTYSLTFVVTAGYLKTLFTKLGLNNYEYTLYKDSDGKTVTLQNTLLNFLKSHDDFIEPSKYIKVR